MNIAGPVEVEVETPSEGGWQASKFKTLQEFSSMEEAEDFLSSDKFVLVVDDRFDKFWQDNIEWRRDRYRIKTREPARKET